MVTVITRQLLCDENDNNNGIHCYYNCYKTIFHCMADIISLRTFFVRFKSFSRMNNYILTVQSCSFSINYSTGVLIIAFECNTTDYAKVLVTKHTIK